MRRDAVCKDTSAFSTPLSWGNGPCSALRTKERSFLDPIDVEDVVRIEPVRGSSGPGLRLQDGAQRTSRTQPVTADPATLFLSTNLQGLYRGAPLLRSGGLQVMSLTGGSAVHI